MIDREKVVDGVITFLKEKWNKYATSINETPARTGTVLETICDGVYNVNFGEYTEKVHSGMGTVDKDGNYVEHKETLPENLNTIRYVPRSDEVASAFPLCVVLPEQSPESEYIRKKNAVMYLTSTIFVRSSWQRSDQDVLYRFTEMINKYTPASVIIHSFTGTEWTFKKMLLLPVEENYSLDSYGDDFLLYSTEVRLQVRF